MKGKILDLGFKRFPFSSNFGVSGQNSSQARGDENTFFFKVRKVK